MPEKETRWIARLTQSQNFNLDELLELASGLDIWERHADYLVVAGSDLQLSEIERRGVGHVERIETIDEFQKRMRQRGETAE